jgi:hypothetical protein
LWISIKNNSLFDAASPATVSVLGTFTDAAMDTRTSGTIAGPGSRTVAPYENGDSGLNSFLLILENGMWDSNGKWSQVVVLPMPATHSPD